jgi:hypothetical protein
MGGLSHSWDETLTRRKSDFLIPRRRHSGIVDPTAEEEARAFAYLDRPEAQPGSEYDELNWSLGAVLKWIATRSRDAVNALTIDEEALWPAVSELQQSLEHGEVVASGGTVNNPLPQLLRAETWGPYILAITDEDNLFWPCVTHEASDVEYIVNVRLRRDDVLRRWPALGAPDTVPPSTQGKETACKGWLSAMMRANPDEKRSKEGVWAEASAKFPGLARRAFDRAWTAAIKDSGAAPWGTPGRRPKIKSPH